MRHGAPLLGKRVLITGAAGGVGNLAVQLAARSGARVTAVVGSAERARVLDGLGAAEIVTDIEQAQGRFALILEAAGGRSLKAAIDRVEAKGTVVIFGNSSGEPTEIDFRMFAEHQNARIQAFHYFTCESRGPLRARSRAARLAGRGRLAAAVSSANTTGATSTGSARSCAAGRSPAKPCFTSDANERRKVMTIKVGDRSRRASRCAT